jgi:hypothetical protein
MELEPASKRNAYTLTIWFILSSLAVVCAVLWAVGERTYFVKPLTESHNIVLAAANVRDWVTFLVQDVAASSEPAAHPFWYIHHPNLPAKSISLALGGLGFGLEGQVGIMLALNVGGLAIAAVAFSRISRAAALAAILVAATSYWSFHYSAGDLCRGPLYLLLWPLLLALFGNETLESRWRNLTIAAVCALSVLSDWGFALFVVTLSFCWASLGRGSPPWRWSFLVVVLPSAAAFILYEEAVVAAVGWDFFLLDTYVTYFGRLGVGGQLDYRDVLDRFRDNLVIIWPPQGVGTISLLPALGTLAVNPLLNTGPLWILALPALVTGTAMMFARIGWSRVLWLALAALALLNVLALAPLPLFILAAAALAIGASRIRVSTPGERLCGLAAVVMIAIAVPVIIFPGFTIGFSIGGGRPPFPLLEMSGAALLAEFAASGQLAHWLDRMATSPVRRLFATIPGVGWVLLGVSMAILAAPIASEPSGMSWHLAAGLAVAMVGAPLVLLVQCRSYVRARQDMDGSGQDGTNPRIRFLIRFLERWQLPLLFVAATAVLASHVSDEPTVLGRYSSKYATFLMAPALVTLAAFLLTAFRAPASRLLEAIVRASASPGMREWLARPPAWRCVGVVALGVALCQVGWFVLSVAANPPKPIAYAALLAGADYRGKGILTTSYEGIAWYSTGGWAYMSPTNPPRFDPVSSRFRHLADWRNEEKYGRPDFFLCDNTLFSFVPPGKAIEATPVPMTCRHCTCRDVASFLRESGHEVVVDRDDFSIVKFSWPQP